MSKKHKKGAFVHAKCHICGLESTLGQLVACYHRHTKQHPGLRVVLHKQGNVAEVQFNGIK